MTRLGWAILAIIVVAAVAFGSVLTFGGTPGSPPAPLPHESAVAPGLLAVPVAGVPRGALADSWGDAREGGARAHHGIDIMAPDGTPVLAAADGVVEKLYQSRLGGTTLYVRSADGRWTHYYAHLAGYADGVHEGLQVRSGQALGYVGDTGDAGSGNYHLHFGVTRRQPGARWWQGEDVNPYPLLAGRAVAR